MDDHNEDHHDHHRHHHHHHHKTAHKVLDKISNKLSALKDDIVDVVKDRSNSTGSDRRSSFSSDASSSNVIGVSYRLHDESPSATLETKYPMTGLTAETASMASAASVSSLASSASQSTMPPPRHTIDQLAINMGFGGLKPSFVNQSNTSLNTNGSTSASLINTAPVSVPTAVPVSPVTPVSTSSGGSSPPRFELSDTSSLNPDIAHEIEGGVQERIITKIDPDEVVAKPTVVTVPKDPVRRTALLLSGPKFQLNSTAIPKSEELKVDTDTIYRIAIVVGVISLIFAIWKPITSYFSGFFVGVLLSGALVYIALKNYINRKAEETTIEEWIEFPALEAMLAKVDKEDKETNIQTTGAYIAFQRYDADRDDDFVRYPCDIRLDGYRLIIQLASKLWSEEKRPEKEMKFVGYREYLVKEARMILVPEATLTRAKYWMNDYPIVIQDLQILDKQIHSKQQLDKSKLDTNDFFTNNATILSIWFETAPQKEEWFHKLSLVLRKGKEEIERTNSLMNLTNDTLSTSGSTPSLYRRLAQTEADTELVTNPPTIDEIEAAVAETKKNAEEFREKAKMKEPETDEVDASGTRRATVRKSKPLSPNEVSLQAILQSPECLDEAAITINFMARRLLCDMFEIPVFKDLLKTKVEMKLREVAISILENLRVTSIDMGNTFPVILKVESMQWNTQGLWFNLFLYYRGSFKLSVRTRVVPQKLINYDPKRDKPIFAQHHSAQIVHKDEERIDEDDLVQRQKLLAKEPEIPEMAVSRRLGTVLTNLALNKYFQMFINIPFVKRLFEKFSEKEVGADVELTGFSGLLTLNIPPPPSDRIWVGFPELPDMNIKVVPTYGEQQYNYTLLQDFLSARIRGELKRLVVLPAMDDQLLPFFRDWVIDIIGEIVSKPIDPLTDNYREKLNTLAAMREKLQGQNPGQDLKREASVGSSLATSTESTHL